MNILNELKEIFFPNPTLLKPGIVHYKANPDSTIPYRMHLRIEPDGNGILLLNAKTVLHLNQTATEFSYYFINQTPVEEAVKKIARRYRVPTAQARQDYHELLEKFSTLLKTADVDPESFLDVERLEPYSERLSAPYRLDCALTYRVNSGDLSVSPLERVKRELSSEEWKTILKKSWDAGIPHVIFTGGEPTLRPDLPDIIAFAEELGQVTGLLTDGLRLSDSKYFHKLLNNGLDHIMIILQPEEEQSWEALRDVLMEDIFTTVHVTIRDTEKEVLESLMNRLSSMGVYSISLSTNNPDHLRELDFARQIAAELDLSLVWDIPVPYSNLNPVKYEVNGQFERAEEDGSTVFADGAGNAWLYIEPDGDVLACQGKTEVLGNFLIDDWEKIWNK